MLGKLVSEARLQEFLSRLLGRAVELNDPITLSSARKAQVASWLRSENIPFAYKDVNVGVTSVARILGSAAGPAAVPVPAPDGPPFPASSASGGLSVGIDLESAANLPVADDFRTHPFYKANFTPREIAHCIERGDPIESFCGLWAAKEAVVKAGGASPAEGRFREVEIILEPGGKPTFPACALSISHESGFAVAVCIRLDVRV